LIVFLVSENSCKAISIEQLVVRGIGPVEKERKTKLCWIPQWSSPAAVLYADKLTKEGWLGEAI